MRVWGSNDSGPESNQAWAKLDPPPSSLLRVQLSRAWLPWVESAESCQACLCQGSCPGSTPASSSRPCPGTKSSIVAGCACLGTTLRSSVGPLLERHDHFSIMWQSRTGSWWQCVGREKGTSGCLSGLGGSDDVGRPPRIQRPQGLAVGALAAAAAVCGSFPVLRAVFSAGRHHDSHPDRGCCRHDIPAAKLGCHTGHS